MSTPEKTEAGATTRSSRPQFFRFGGPIPPGRPGYVTRPVDAQLMAGVAGGTFINIVGAPQTGKSSLLLHAAEALRGQHAAPAVAFIDLGQQAQRDGYQDAARWFYAIAYRLARQLRVGFDLQAWWSDHALMSHHHRFVELLREFALASGQRQVVLLFDDIHELLGIDSGEQLLSAFRAAFDARATDPELARLVIVMAGNGDGQFARASTAHSPYTVATPLAIGNMTLGETLRLAPALGFARQQAELAMQRIFDWVAGQPALTQYLASQLAVVDVNDDVVQAVDRIVQRRFEQQRDSVAHAPLLAVEAQILNAPADLRERMLVVVGRIAKQQRMLLDPANAAHDRLLRSGVLAVSPDGYLIPSSRLSRRYFNAGWANQHLPLRFGGLIKGAVLALLFLMVPLWYRQYLPQPHVQAMTDRATTIPQLIEQYESFSRWPGYEGTARRLTRLRLAEYARAADNVAALNSALLPLREQLGETQQADALAGAFWTRQRALAERNGDRAGAIWALLQGLDYLGVEARRRLQGLVSSDLPDLTGVLRTGEPFADWRYRPRGRLLLTRSATRIDTWRLPDQRGALEQVRALQPHALAVTPAIARQRMPALRRPEQLTLSLQIEHERVSDLELSLTSPDGRSGSMVLSDALFVGNQVVLPVARFEAFAEATPAGDWSIAISDRRPQMQGTLLEARFEGYPLPDTVRGIISISDPQAIAAADVAMEPRGRFALAWPDETGTHAAIWDLQRGQPVASIPATADVDVVGFVNGGREVLMREGAALRTYRLSDGVQLVRPLFDAAVGRVWISSTSRWLSAQAADTSATLRIFDLDENQQVAALNVGVTHNDVDVSPDGQFVATADADQVVRIWRTSDKSLAYSQVINAPIGTVSFAPSGQEVLVRPAAGGLVSWRFAATAEPARWADDVRWSFVHDQQTGLSLVGSTRDGYRVHDFDNSRDRSLPVLSFADQRTDAALLRVRDNMLIVAAPEQGSATVWRASLAALPVGAQRVRRAWLSVNGQAVAFANQRDAYSVLRLDAGVDEISDLEDDLSLLSHVSVPELVRFSVDGRFALSVEASGLFRVRDIEAGRFIDFIGRTARGVIDAAFNDGGDQFVLLLPQAFEVYETATGALVKREYRDRPLGAVTAATAGTGWLIADVDGRVFKQATMQPGTSALGSLSAAGFALAREPRVLAASPHGVLAAVTAAGVQLYDLQRDEAMGASIAVPGEITEIQFSASGRFLVVRAGQWLHRIRVEWASPTIVGSRLLPPDMLRHAGFSLPTADGIAVRMLRGLDEPAVHTLWFDYREEPAIGQSVQQLQTRWSLISVLSDQSRASSNN